MGHTSDKYVPYVPNAIANTGDHGATSKYETVATIGSLKDDIATTFSKMPIAKLFLVLSMTVYFMI